VGVDLSAYLDQRVAKRRTYPNGDIVVLWGLNKYVFIDFNAAVAERTTFGGHRRRETVGVHAPEEEAEVQGREY